MYLAWIHKLHPSFSQPSSQSRRMDSEEKRQTIELTVLRADGFRRPNICSWFSKLHVEIRCNSKVWQTTSLRGMAPHVWNQKFQLELADRPEFFLSVYKKRLFSQPLSIGTFAVAVDLEARDQELVKTLPSSKMSVKYQLHEPKREYSSMPRCPVFAFIVGIDQYMSNTIPNLRGCVNDAQTMRTFLMNRFNIPEKQVAFLIDDRATRDAILQTFRTHLIENANIETGDTIIIYYAGHGSRVQVPDSWSSADGKIETFVPHDEREKDAQGEMIHGIPDRTMSALLSQLATAKGNNITVILDCCYSGGLTRGSSPSPSNILPVPRYVETFLPIPENLDRELWNSIGLGRSGNVDLPSGVTYRFMHAHVLLAACRHQQRARECISAITGEPCGFFTDSLIKALRGIGKLNRVTYAELLELLPTLPDQNPQCEGANKGRFVFEGEGPPREVHSCAVEVKEDGTLKVDVGSMFGVVVGTQFVSEKDARAVTDPDRVFVAVSIDLDSSILIPRVSQEHLDLSPGTRLVMADWKNEAAMMKVFIQPDNDLQLTSRDLLVPRMKPKFLVVESQESADLSLRQTPKGEISLTRLDARFTRYNLPDVTLNIPAVARIPYVLNAVAQFNYFLRKHNGQDVLKLGEDVELEMHQLAGDFGFRVPDTEVGNLMVDGEVRFPLDTEAKYGFAICNHSRYDLFPYLFYFDPMTYSIDAWYLPESKTMAAPLPARAGDLPPTRVTIGYGAGGGYAFQFVIPDGIDTDTGFLKLFVTTKYLDLQRIEQPAAVDAVVMAQSRGQTELPLNALDEGVWGAWDIPITIFVEEAS